MFHEKNLTLTYIGLFASLLRLTCGWPELCRKSSHKCHENADTVRGTNRNGHQPRCLRRYAVRAMEFLVDSSALSSRQKATRASVARKLNRP